MAKPELTEKIQEAIETSDFRWRTVNGLSRDLKLDQRLVEDILSESGQFVRSRMPNAHGEALYTTVGRYRRETPFLDRLFGAAANTVTS
jgi:hypothetical protein